jgi:hypothetical protein
MQPKLIEAVAAALAANTTPRARRALEDLVDGAPNMPRSSMAAVAVLKAVATQPGPAGDDLLFRAITAADRADDGPATSGPTKLPATALTLIRTRKSESLAVRLATYMLSPQASRKLYDQLWTCLREPRAENMAAQVLLYEGDGSPQATRSWLESRIAAYGSSTLARLLGIPLAAAEPASAGAVRSAAAVPPPGGSWPNRQEATLAQIIVAADPHRLAEQLWNPRLETAVRRRLETMETLEKRPALVALAGTLPRASVRAALLRAMKRHWEEGPQGLKMLRSAESITVEPGFVALLKLLRRDDQPPPATGKSPAGQVGNHLPSARTPARPGAAGSEARKYADVLKVKVGQEKVGQQWMAFSQDVTQAVCRRLDAAARAKQHGTGGTGATAEPAELPFALHSPEKVAAVYRLDWPEDLQERTAAAPSPLEVRYVRIEEEAAPSRILAYYRRQVPEGRQHMLAGGGWIDQVVVDKARSSVCSTDVLVTKSAGSALGLPQQEQELTVEILTVKFAEPAEPDPVVANP